MSDEIATLKAELQVLSGRIQAERNDEVRHGLQRGRLEAERAQLLVKLVEAMTPAATTAVASPAVASAAPYNILMSPLTCPKGREVSAAIPVTMRTPAPSRASGKRKHNPKPQGLETMETMILAVLQSGDWMRPNRVTQAIRDRYWPSAPRNSAPPVMWRMGRDGHLEKGELGYRLPVPAAGSPAWTKSNGQVA